LLETAVGQGDGLRGGGIRKVLTIAGSDSGGGAGIQADLKTFQELGTFGMSVITAVTAQNTVGVHGVYPLPVEAVEAQLDAVLGDIGADAVKTGMLFSPEIIHAAASRLEKAAAIKLVVDPVMISKHGSPLLREDAAEALRLRLLPLAEVVTPNIPEACALLGLKEREIGSLEAMKDASKEMLGFGCRHVFLKGGHLAGTEAAADVLLSASYPNDPVVLTASRIPTVHTHGTGCTIASALAALLARGLDMEEAARGAKAFTLAAIASGGPLGAGTGALWHAAWRSEDS